MLSISIKFQDKILILPSHISRVVFDQIELYDKYKNTDRIIIFIEEIFQKGINVKLEYFRMHNLTDSINLLNDEYYYYNDREFIFEESERLMAIKNMQNICDN